MLREGNRGGLARSRCSEWGRENENTQKGYESAGVHLLLFKTLIDAAVYRGILL